MSVADPLGGVVVSGGVIVVTIGGVPVYVSGLGNPRISYNGQTIDLPKLPFEFTIDPVVPRTSNITLTGMVEVLRLPRMDVLIRVRFRPSTDIASMYAVNNWWQWAQQGNLFEVMFDSAKTAQTVITAAAGAGTNSLTVAGTTGIVENDYYVLRGGPNYQIVRVTNISGNTLTLATSLNFNFASGAVLRDLYYWVGVIRDERASTPVRHVLDIAAGPGQVPNSFELEFEFYESVGASS